MTNTQRQAVELGFWSSVALLLPAFGLWYCWSSPVAQEISMSTLELGEGVLQRRCVDAPAVALCDLSRWLVVCRLLVVASLGVALLSTVVGGLSLLVAKASPRKQVAAFWGAAVALRWGMSSTLLLQGTLLALLWLKTGALSGGTRWLFWSWVVLLLSLSVQFVLRTQMPKPGPVSVLGRKLDAQSGLWRRVVELCEVIGVQPPDHLIASVGDKVVVTQCPLIVDGEVLAGRTLLISLPLFTTMEGDEVDSILCHELAHFQQGVPKTAFGLYALHHGVQTQRWNLKNSGPLWPAHKALLTFYEAFYSQSVGHSRREELDADAVAASTVSADALGRALVRACAYSSFRAQVEPFLKKSTQTNTLGVHLADQFRQFCGTNGQLEDLSCEVASVCESAHPSPTERLAAVAFRSDTKKLSALFCEAPRAPWLAFGDDERQIERSLWEEYVAQNAKNSRG